MSNIINIRNNIDIHSEYITPYGNVHFNNYARHNGIRLSGGFDSAVILYMLAKTLSESTTVEEPEIHPFTIIRGNPTTHEQYTRVDVKPYAENIIAWVRDKFPHVTIHDTHTEYANYWWVHKFENGMNLSSYSMLQDIVSNYLKWELGSGNLERFGDEKITATPQMLLYCEYSGLTLNPPPGELPQSDETHRDDLDSRTVIQNSLTAMHDHIEYPWSFTYEPFRNADKRVPFWLADKFGVLEDILSITRSCEGDIWNTENFTKECNECWWCLERSWAHKNYKNDK